MLSFDRLLSYLCNIQDELLYLAPNYIYASQPIPYYAHLLIPTRFAGRLVEGRREMEVFLLLLRFFAGAFFYYVPYCCYPRNLAVVLVTLDEERCLLLLH